MGLLNPFQDLLNLPGLLQNGVSNLTNLPSTIFGGSQNPANGLIPQLFQSVQNLATAQQGQTSEPQGQPQVNPQGNGLGLANLAPSQPLSDAGNNPPYDITRNASGGAATHPDAFSGMDPNFRSALANMFHDAPPFVQNSLSVFSGFRSYDQQSALYNASNSKGHMVASPGTLDANGNVVGGSMHEHGLAADLKFGSPAARQWVHDNAAHYGLTFPMSYEPWHVELAGARAQLAANGGQNLQLPTVIPQPGHAVTPDVVNAPAGGYSYKDFTGQNKLVVGAGGNAAPQQIQSPAVHVLAGNPQFNDFMSTVQSGFDFGGHHYDGITNPYALAAIAATGQHESGWTPQHIGGQWQDPDMQGKNAMSGGAMSWRGDRLNNLHNFAQTIGGDPRDPTVQAKFLLAENPKLNQQLQAAGSAHEAMALMNKAWAFAGYNIPGNKEAAQRIRDAEYSVSMFRDGRQIALSGGAPGTNTGGSVLPGGGVAPGGSSTELASADAVAGRQAAQSQQDAYRRMMLKQQALNQPMPQAPQVEPPQRKQIDPNIQKYQMPEGTRHLRGLSPTAVIELARQQGAALRGGAGESLASPVGPVNNGTNV